MEHTESTMERRLRVLLAVPLVVTLSLLVSSISLAEEPPPGEPPATPAMEGMPSMALPSEPASSTEAGGVQGRAVPQVFRLQNLWKPYEYVNIESGALVAGAIQPAWLSAQWTLEQMSSSHLRIHNVWKPDQYLNIESGALVASPVGPGWLSAQWTLTGVAPPNVLIYRICNVWKPDQCLNIESGALVASPVGPGWLSAQWTLPIIATPVVAAPPPPVRPTPGTSILPAPPPIPQDNALPLPPPNSPPPTPNIAAVAKAMQYNMRSLSILVSALPGLALTQPVTISIGYFPTGTALGPHCLQRVTQPYATSTGNTFVCSLADIVERQVVIVHLDITLSEPKPGGGVYSYNVPLTVDPVPIYDVTISPLQFTLLDTCNLIGDTDILFSWFAPDGRPKQKEFHTRGGQRVSIGEFQWSHTEVVYNLLFRQPSLMFVTVNATDLVAPVIIGSRSSFNLWPGKTHTVQLGLVKAANEDTCEADIQYTMTYTLREYFGDPHVRDHR